MVGSWPIATKKPPASISHVSSGFDRRAQSDAGDLLVAEHLVDDRVRDDLDLVVRADAVEHDLRRAELVAPVDQRDPRAEARQEQRLLHRGVAAADDDDRHVAEERAVAGRAGGDAAPLEALLGLEPEPARGRAGGDDHGLGEVLVVPDPDPERTLGEIDLRDVVGDVLGAEALRLVAELLHHRRPHHAVRVPRVVLDVARDHQLPAPPEALDHERAQIGARAVQRCGVPRGAAADDDHFTCFSSYLY